MVPSMMGGDPSPEEVEELMQLIERYESSTKGFGDVPDELRELMDNLKRSKGQPTDEAAAQDVTPQPGFVIKTTDQDGRKVFINVCHSNQMPAPGGWGSGLVPDNVLRALEVLQSEDAGGGGAAEAPEALRFPLSCSEVVPDSDKTGAPCVAVDCMLHSQVVAAAQASRPLKSFVIQLALQWVGSKHKLELSPAFKLPKLAYKGAAVRPQRVRIEGRRLVTDVTWQRAQEEPPSFPLLPARAAKQKAGAAGGAGAVAKKAAAAAAAAAAGAAAGHAQQQPAAAPAAGEGPAWPCDVKCEGRPVTQLVVTLQLPPPPPSSSSSSSSWAADDLSVEVCGQQLRVSASTSGQQPCLVQLPFAAGAGGGAAALQPCGRQLVVRLPYLPVTQWVAALQQAAPAAFSQLPVVHASYMELD